MADESNQPISPAPTPQKQNEGMKGQNAQNDGASPGASGTQPAGSGPKASPTPGFDAGKDKKKNAGSADSDTDTACDASKSPSGQQQKSPDQHGRTHK
jgi:hypothetical protein